MSFMTLLLILFAAGCTGAVAMILYRNLQTTGPATPVSRLPKKTKSIPPKAENSPGSPFRAVSIAPGESPCAAVKALQGKYYLVELGDAPTLPLAGCNAGKCGCRYNHHADRRQSNEDRRDAHSLRTDLHQQGGNAENRMNQGRRATD